MSKLFDVEIVRYYSKATTIVVEAENEQDAKDLIANNKEIHNEIEERIASANLSWDDDSVEVYPINEEAVAWNHNITQ